MFKVTRLLILGVLLGAPAFADISVGYLSILADSPTSGLQELTISNVTGQGNCDPVEYTACTNLDFTDWTLTVNYTSSYYNSGAPAPTEPSPFVITEAGSALGDITPGSQNNTFDFDLCGGAGSCASGPGTTITSVEFSGQISPAAICLYDSGAGGCNNAAPNTFFANPNFDLVWNAASPGGSPYVDENSIYAQSSDITVTNQGGSNALPEPNQYFAIATILCALFILRSKFYKRA
jgi:hypothetical protein